MIAIIPARGGSKRIQRKNIRLFQGKPIIAYAIQNAVESGLFEEVIVSTDDVEIAEIAKEYGASVPFMRSEKNSDDYATTSDVLLEVLDFFEKNGRKVNDACCIYATSPLLEVKDLVNAKIQFEKGNFDTLISSVKYSFPIQRAFRIKNSTEVDLVQPEYMNSRSQDLEPTYHDAACFYFFNISKFQTNKNLWFGKVGAYELDESRVQDIDSPEDWKIAELKYKLLKGI